MRARHMNTVLHSSRSPDSVWWGRVRFVLGMAQMAASVVAVVLLAVAGSNRRLLGQVRAVGTAAAYEGDRIGAHAALAVREISGWRRVHAGVTHAGSSGIRVRDCAVYGATFLGRR